MVDTSLSSPRIMSEFAVAAGFHPVYPVLDVLFGGVGGGEGGGGG